MLIADRDLPGLTQSLRSHSPTLEGVVLSPADDGQWGFEGFAAPAPTAADRAPAQAAADWPALTQYSTGSTGSSKRITRTHGQVFMEFKAVSETMKIGTEDRVLGVAPFFRPMPGDAGVTRPPSQ